MEIRVGTNDDDNDDKTVKSEGYSITSIFTEY